jgi:ATP-dependent helicase/nuclease subunit A
LHHRFLEHLDLDKAEDAKALMTQAEALVQRGVFSEVEASTLDLAGISTFWASPVGRQIRTHLVNVRRELPFTARFALAEVQAALGQPPINLSSEEFVVVQGVVDLAVLLDKEIWVLDFKTDSVFGEALRLRANGYAPQLRLYAMALEAIYQKPVRHQWLHFLNAGETVELEQKVVTG